MSEEQKQYDIARQLAAPQLSLTDIKKYIAPNATDKELFLFMGISNSYSLNPFKREIHFIKYGNNPASIIVGYETYLKRAERTGKLDGWKCWIEKDDIGEKAVIEIKRKDQSSPIRWEVYRKEFDKQQSTWKAMPTFMLKKVAIAQGFRLAFPDDLGGMPYIPEEMPQPKGATTETTSETLPVEVIDVEPIQEPKEPASKPPERSQEAVPDPPPSEPLIPPVSKAQKVKIRELMVDKGIAADKDQKAFYDYVMKINDTSEKAQSFIDQFEDYYTAYSRAVDGQGQNVQ